VRRKVNDVARMLRIEDKLQSPATKLSGGQMQRVAIGRALVRDPSLYLMDEPLSSLDAKLRNDLRLELKRIQQDLGATMLYVTHDQIEALTMATRIGVLQQGRCRPTMRRVAGDADACTHDHQEPLDENPLVERAVDTHRHLFRFRDVARNVERVSFETLLEPCAAPLVIFKYENAYGSSARIGGCNTKFLFQSLN